MNIDRKFQIIASNPVTGKCYSEDNAILMVAKDAALVPTLEFYREECRRQGSNSEHIESITLLIGRVKDYQASEGSKIPDTLGDEIVRCINGKDV